MPHVPFTSSDSWVLLSIAYASSQHPAELWEVIGWGDALSHAIFTPQELRRGLARLVSAGYVTHTDAVLGITPAGRQLLDRATEDAGEAPNTLTRWRALDRLLGATTEARNDPNFDDPDWRYPSLTDDLFTAAVSAYEAEFARLLPSAIEQAAALSKAEPARRRFLSRLSSHFRRSGERK